MKKENEILKMYVEARMLGFPEKFLPLDKPSYIISRIELPKFCKDQTK